MPNYDAHRILADLASSDDGRARDAANAIVQLHPDSEVDEFPFIAGLSAADDKVAFWCGVALKRLGPRASAAIPSLLTLLQRKQLHLRQTAVGALASVGPHDPAARAAIFAAFGDDNAFIRREALQAGLTLPDRSDDDLAAIAGMATDPDEDVRNLALRSIGAREESDPQ